jgi:hypothetical protein
MSIKSPGLGAGGLGTLIANGGYVESTFTITLTGVNAAVTGTAKYIQIGKLVLLTIPTLSGTSDNVAKGYSGIPAAITPATAQRFFAHVVDSALTPNVGELQLGTNGTAVLLIQVQASGAFTATFTNTGAFTVAVNTIAYTLN